MNWIGIMKNAQTVIKASSGEQDERRHCISGDVCVCVWGGYSPPRGDGSTGTGITRRHSEHDRGDGRWAGLLAEGDSCYFVHSHLLRMGR